MRTCDVAIIGLGLMGSSALHSLSGRGADVLGFDPLIVGEARGSSHGSCRVDICSHEPPDDGGIGGVSADQAMGAEQEQIAYLSNRRGAGQRREIASFASMFANYDLIDLVRTKPGNLDRCVGDYEFLEFSF